MSCCFSEEMLSIDLDLALKSDGENGVNMQAVLFANPILDVTIQKNGRNKGKQGVMTVKNVLSGITGFRVGNAQPNPPAETELPAEKNGPTPQATVSGREFPRPPAFRHHICAGASAAHLQGFWRFSSEA